MCVCVCAYVCTCMHICINVCVCLCLRSRFLLRMRGYISRQLPLHPHHIPICGLWWDDRAVCGVEGGLVVPLEACLHIDTEVRKIRLWRWHIPLLAVCLPSEKSCYYLFCLSQFCTKMPSMLRSHFYVFVICGK